MQSIVGLLLGHEVRIGIVSDEVLSGDLVSNGNRHYWQFIRMI
jgi:hypothetical protein